MKAAFLFLFLLAWSRDAHCQAQISQSRVGIFVNPGLHLNHLNLANDDRYPASLSTKNTLSAFGGLSYTKLVRMNWQLAGELGIGRKHHDIGMTLPTDMYGPAARAAFGEELRFRSSTRILYLQVSLWAGYQHPVTKRFWLEARAGISKQIYFGGEYDAKVVIMPTTDSAGINYIQTVMSWGNGLGAAPSVGLINPGPQSGELYFGCRVSARSFFFSGYQFGISGSRQIPVKFPGGLYTNIYGPGSQLPVSHDRYEDLNTVVGFRIGATF